MELDILSAWQTTTSSTSIQIDSLSKVSQHDQFQLSLSLSLSGADQTKEWLL